MQKFCHFILAFFLFINIIKGSENYKEFFQYLHPRPESKFVSTQTTLIIRFKDRWEKDLNNLSLDFNVYGQSSGNHEGQIILANANKTYIFKPYRTFNANEKVQVEINSNIPGFQNPLRYSFTTSRFLKYERNVLNAQQEEFTSVKKISQPNTYGKLTFINDVAVPSDFPKIDVDILETTAPGKLFLSNLDGYPYIMILENDGTPYFYRRMQETYLDFKVQPTGTLTFGSLDGYYFLEMNSNFEIIDTLVCGYEYITDYHDIQLLPDGHKIFLTKDFQLIDMSQIVPDGDTSAYVIGNHVIELDDEDNIVLEWRSWDHFNILDARHKDLTTKWVDYVHMNAVAVDYDGNILISSRNFEEITKIDRNTGEIIWRLGGNNNQFQFLNDDPGISFQHDIRPVPDKPDFYTIFDNGNFHTPSYSRAIEYFLDTENMTATPIWEYRHTPDRYASKMGNVQRLDNGNTLINWVKTSLPKATEVTQDNQIVYEANFSNPSESYRTFRYEWDGVANTPYLIAEAHTDRVTLIFNKFGDPDVLQYVIYYDQSPDPSVIRVKTTNNWIDLTDLENNTKYYFRVTASNHLGEESSFSNQVNVLVKYSKPGENLLLNSDFTNNFEHWVLFFNSGSKARSSVEDGVYRMTIDTTGSDATTIQLRQTGLEIIQGNRYRLEFDGYADEMRTIGIDLEMSYTPFIDYSKIGSIPMTQEKNHFSFEFEMQDLSDYNARLVFNCGNSPADIYLDNISLKQVVFSEIVREKEAIPQEYALLGNYPNPFNGQTVIRYAVPQESHIELEIYNIIGELISKDTYYPKNAGIYDVHFNAEKLSSGIYFYVMEAKSIAGNKLYRNVRKMMVIK